MSTSTFPIATDSFVNPAANNKRNSPSLAGVITLVNDAAAALEAKVGITNSTTSGTLDYITARGWYPVTDTWTYASADSPTFIVTVPSDATTKYQPGMRIQLTQTTVKYFLITAVTSTTITIYGGTDYTLANAAISGISISSSKSPFGFPLNPLKWSVIVTDVVDRTQPSATQNTWYNISQLNATLPIGIWEVGYEVDILTRRLSNGTCNIYTTLSTTSAAAGDALLTGFTESRGATDGTAVSISLMVKRTETIAITTKTPYFFNMRTTLTSNDVIGVLGTQGTSIVKAVSTYL